MDSFCAADDIDTSKMHANMSFVPIDQLAAYVDKKVRGQASWKGGT